MPYIGKVIELDEDSVHVDFMEPYVKGNSLSQTFQWPLRTDDVWVERCGILGVISAPEDIKRGFKLAAEIVSNILELRSVWLITHKNCQFLNIFYRITLKSLSNLIAFVFSS